MGPYGGTGLGTLLATPYDVTDEELAGRSILVVDDEDVFLRSVAEGLAAELPGVEIHTAHDGEEALGKLGQHVIDLVVTDVKMPRMDGMALIAEMVSRGIRSSVVLVTAFGTRTIEREARRQGVVSVIDKPIDFPFLVEVCRNTLRTLDRGMIGGVTLAGFLQLLEMERRSCTVRVFARGASGRIFIDLGRVMGSVHADLEGMEALCQILSWPEPRIELRGLEAKAHGAPMSLQEALLEAARLSDELHRDEQDSEDELSWADESSWFDDPISDEPDAFLPAPVRASTTKPRQSAHERAGIDMANINESLTTAMSIQGALAVALVDHESGMCLGSKANGFPIETAAAGNTEVVRSKMRVMKELGISGRINDILITLDTQYHLIVPLRSGTLFLYLAIDRNTGNLALARLKLSEIEKGLSV